MSPPSFLPPFLSGRTDLSSFSSSEQRSPSPQGWGKVAGTSPIPAVPPAPRGLSLITLSLLHVISWSKEGLGCVVCRGVAVDRALLVPVYAGVKRDGVAPLGSALLL